MDPKIKKTVKDVKTVTEKSIKDAKKATEKSVKQSIGCLKKIFHSEYIVGIKPTKSEVNLIWGTAAASFIALFLYSVAYFNWAWWQYIIVSILGMDIIGGAVAQMTQSVKNYYHSPLKDKNSTIEKFLKCKVSFTAFHIHPIILSLVFLDVSLFYGVFWYVILVGAAYNLKKIPDYIQRQTAIIIVIAATLLHIYCVKAPVGLEWFIPVLFIKIIAGRMVSEKPHSKEKKTEIKKKTTAVNKTKSVAKKTTKAVKKK